MKDELVHAGAPLIILLLIRKLQGLTSSYLKVFEILLFSDSYTRFSVPRTIKFEIFGKREALLTTPTKKRHCWNPIGLL